MALVVRGALFGGPQLCQRFLRVAERGRHLIRSVYLNLDPARQVRRSYRVAFKGLTRQVEAALDESAREGLQRDVARVERYLEAAPRHGKGRAIFSCSAHDVWQVYHLAVPVADDVHVGRTPYSRPLLDVLDEYERYAVALGDREKARLFTVYVGEIEEEDRIADLVPGRHDQGGWSQANYQRHHDAHVHWHLERVAEHLAALLRFRVG